MRNNYDINEDSFTSENYTPFFTNNSQFEDNIFNPLNLSPFPSLSFHYQNSKYEQQSINVEKREDNEENKEEMNIEMLSELMDASQSENELNLKSDYNYVNKLNENNGSFKLDEKEESKPKAESREENGVPAISKKTNFTSKEVQQINPVLVEFNPKQISKRIDYHKKYFKTNFVKFLKRYGNDLIKDSDLPKQFKRKISAPNHISFTANVKESDNYEFLFFIVQDILTHYVEGTKCKNSLQIKNQNLIEDILAFIENNDEEKYEDIKSFFKMTVEDAYSLFYESKEFKKYAAETKTIYLDKEFRIQKGYSLLEKNGFIKMCRMYKYN